MQDRNYGIDMLRLLSMYLVVILHVLGQGGVLDNVSGINYYISWAIEIITFCAVDCFAIISGYVGYNEEKKPYLYSKYIKMWIPVFLYSFGITLFAFLLGSETVGFRSLIYAAFPVSSEAYWYFSAYTGLFFLVPLINKLVRQMSEDRLSKMVLVLFVVFSAFSTWTNLFGDALKLNYGYSVAWLVILYIVGAWIKKNALSRLIWRTKTKAGIIVCACFVITLIFKMFVPRGGVLVSYTSPSILIPSIVLVSLFAGIQGSERAKRWVKIWAPASFGVYLIHTQPCVFGHFIRGAFCGIANASAWVLPIEVLGGAVGVFAACLLIEKARLTMFRICGIDLAINRFIITLSTKISKIHINRAC